MNFNLSYAALIVGFATFVTSVAVSAQNNAPSAARRASPTSTLEQQGARLFTQQCAACHNVAKGTPNKLGPTLGLLFGAKAGNQPKFNYSPALRGANFRWTDAKLDAFLLNPQATVPGNRMAFAGTKPAESRRALIAYLKAATR
ncbi:MAG: cytochrome c family protein [Pigmentiphaga sp.]